MTRNQIDYQKSKETERANRASENLRSRELAELERSNREKEQINWYTAQNQAEVAKRQLLQSRRDELQRERQLWETERRNTLENQRYSRQLTTEAQRYYENVRSNIAREAIDRQRNAEIARYNRAQENLRRLELDREFQVSQQHIANEIFRNLTQYVGTVSRAANEATGNVARMIRR